MSLALDIALYLLAVLQPNPMALARDVAALVRGPAPMVLTLDADNPCEAASREVSE